ncbi:GFA family protein [Celeribacter baekdonensis]|uniref:GFA family protein n=1 Tax=Celeribacter baekdonensis TaxID=875171 RepID=UPI003A94E16E
MSLEKEMHGRCTCGEIEYALGDSFMCVHSCHCTWCQRETGSAFALNGLIERAKLTVIKGTPMEVETASNSGKGQTIVRCPACHVVLWSHYSGAGRALAFVRVGTLEQAREITPDVFIFTSTAVPWMRFPDGAKVYPNYYPTKEVWTPEAIARRNVALGRM